MNLVFRRAIALSLLLSAALFLVISPAFAHVELAGSSPTAGTRLDVSPTVIRLEFSTASDPAGDGLLLYDQSGELVETTVTFESDTVAAIKPLEPLSGGQYLVSWTMKAGDAHPKSGTIGFSVVAATPATAETPAAPTTAATSPAVVEPPIDQTPAAFEALTAPPSTAVADWVGRIARTVSFIAVLLGLGAFVFATMVFEGSKSEARMVGYWARRAGAVILLAVPLEIASQAMLLGGGSILSALSPGLLVEAVQGQFGLAMVLRSVGGAALFLGTRMVTSSRDTGIGGQRTPEPFANPSGGGVATQTRTVVDRFHVIASPIAISGAVAVALSFLFDGHTAVTTPSWLVRFASVVHVVAAAAWVGGVAMLTTVLAGRRRRGEPLDAARLVIPFSTVAAASVVLVGLAGSVLALSIVDSFGDFFSTAWGRTLLLKLGLVATAGAIGGYNHQTIVPLLKLEVDHHKASEDISRVVRIELAVLLGAAVVTAVLVGLAS